MGLHALDSGIRKSIPAYTYVASNISDVCTCMYIQEVTDFLHLLRAPGGSRRVVGHFGAHAVLLCQPRLGQEGQHHAAHEPQLLQHRGSEEAGTRADLLNLTLVYR